MLSAAITPRITPRQRYKASFIFKKKKNQPRSASLCLSHLVQNSRYTVPRLTLPTCSLLARALSSQPLCPLDQSEPSSLSLSLSAIRNQSVQLAGRLVTEINGTSPTVSCSDWCDQINHGYWICDARAHIMYMELLSIHLCFILNFFFSHV